jgi:hypothetical protein
LTRQEKKRLAEIENILKTDPRRYWGEKLDQESLKLLRKKG